MTVCANRDPDEQGGMLTTCATAMGRAGGKRECLCGLEYREEAEREETRVARVPDSAKEAAS